MASANGDEMRRDFPVTEGTSLRLRLYFANQCGCTAAVGSRVFDVSVDGVERLSDFDMVALKGDRVAFMEPFDITADANGLDIEFTHVVENPLINGIEVIDRSVPAGTGTNPLADQVDRTPLALVPATQRGGRCSTVRRGCGCPGGLLGARDVPGR